MTKDEFDRGLTMVIALLEEIRDADITDHGANETGAFLLTVAKSACNLHEAIAAEPTTGEDDNA